MIFCLHNIKRTLINNRFYARAFCPDAVNEITFTGNSQNNHFPLPLPYNFVICTILYIYVWTIYLFNTMYI